MNNLHHQTLALASMFQSANLINQMARGENINQAAFDCSCDSLFTIDAPSVEEIFGPGDGLMQGLKALIGYLGGEEKNPDRTMAYYVLSMIKLEGRLLKNAKMVDKVHKGLQDIQQQTHDFDLSPLARVHKIDGLYQKTISHIKPRILVHGDQHHLNNSDNTSKIRTLLFAGIRAAVLWRQLGGSRLKLLFSRKKYVQQAREILTRINN
jgi:high frequency lysogenization protein